MTDHSNNIVQFPREVIVEQRVRKAKRIIATNLEVIETCSTESTDFQEALKATAAPYALEWAQADLRDALAEREMLTADDTLRFKGLVYRAYPSQAGAN